MDEQVRFAGVWRRFGAWMIDSVVVMGVFLVLVVMGFGEKDLNDMTPLMGVWVKDVLLPLLSLAYYVWMDSSKWQGTIGKRLLGIRVMTVKGDRLSVGRAAVRMGCFVACSFTLGLGSLIMAWTKKKQGLYDMMSDCLVVCSEKGAS